MPEFRLRRKKDKGEPPRRHTLHNDSDTVSQLKEVARMYDEQTQIILGPNEVSVDDAVETKDRRKSVDRKKKGHFEAFINGPSSIEPPVKAVANRRISSKYSDCIFLRHGADVRRCPLPSPITLSTIKQLFINLFDLSPSINGDPEWHLFILDISNTWKPLINVSIVHDQCTLLLVDGNELNPLHQPITPSLPRSSTGTPDDDETLSVDNVSIHDPIVSLLNDEGESLQINDHPLTNSVSEPSLHITLPTTPPNNDNTNDTTNNNDRTVDELLKEINSLKAKHQLEIQSLETELELVKSVKGVTVTDRILPFRKERIKIEPIKEDYLIESEAALNEMSALQSIGEALKTDAIHHKARIDTDEIDALLTMLNGSTSKFTKLQEQYHHLSSNLREVMQKELEVIVSEEQIIKEEGNKLKAATDVCKVLNETFTTLQQLAQLQSQRPLQVPIICTTTDTDRSDLVASINGIDPNHNARLAAINETETNMEKKKKELRPSKRAVRMFELSLQQRQNHLKPTQGVAKLDKQREEKTKALYLEEKEERQKEIERELELAQKALREKRKQEIQEVEKRLEFDSLRQERKEEVEMSQLEEERKRLIDERRSQEEERERLDKLRRDQEKHQRKLKEEQRRQEDERRRIELEKLQQQEERRKIEEDRKVWQDYHHRIGSESPDTRLKRKELLWQHVQQQIQMEDEKEQQKFNAVGRTRKAQTMKGGLSLSDSYFGNDNRITAGHHHFSEAENVPSLHSFIPPVSRTSHSHKDLWRTPDLSRSTDLTRRLAPSTAVTSNLQQQDNLPKFSSSEDSLIKQNLYDSPWNSKKLLLAQNRRGSGASGSTQLHRRNKSDVNDTPPAVTKYNGDHRDTLTPSPVARRRVIKNTPHEHISFSGSNIIRTSQEDTRRYSTPPNNSPPNYSPPNQLTNGIAPPPYFQVVPTAVHNTVHSTATSQLRSDRLTHYPLATNGPTSSLHTITDGSNSGKYKPSISYV